MVLFVHDAIRLAFCGVRKLIHIVTTILPRCVLLLSQVDVVPQDTERAVLEGVYPVANDQLVLLYMQDAHHQVGSSLTRKLIKSLQNSFLCAH